VGRPSRAGSSAASPARAGDFCRPRPRPSSPARAGDSCRGGPGPAATAGLPRNFAATARASPPGAIASGMQRAPKRFRAVEPKRRRKVRICPSLQMTPAGAPKTISPPLVPAPLPSPVRLLPPSPRPCPLPSLPGGRGPHPRACLLAVSQRFLRTTRARTPAFAQRQASSGEQTGRGAPPKKASTASRKHRDCHSSRRGLPAAAAPAPQLAPWAAGGCGACATARAVG